MTSKGHRGKLTGKPLAYKALAIAPDLANSQRKVGAALIDHMHGCYGRCDPGMRRLARVTGYTVGTVQWAITGLCSPRNPDRLFDNVNGGQGKRPSYRVRWDRVEAIVDGFEARTSTPTVQQASNSSRPSTVRGSPNSDSTPTVREHPNSNCSESDQPTVPESPNKTNVRTKGARPAAHQAAGPCRAPFGEEQNSRETTGQPGRAIAVGASAAGFPAGGDRQLDLSVAALIKAARAMADKRSAEPEPARLDRPFITAEQRRENEAIKRLDAGLRNGGDEFYLSALDRLDAELCSKAVAAEIAEPGAGVATVRLAMLTPTTEGRVKWPKVKIYEARPDGDRRLF